MKNLLLFDGNSIFNRAFYGLGNTGNILKTSTGLYTNAVYGFLNILLKNINEEQPTHICVAFDRKAKTFRHEKYDLYKANRTGMPDELALQLPVLKDVLWAMNIYTVEKDGFEADDLIGSISYWVSSTTGEIVILTGDRDSFQLISDNVSIKMPVTRQGATAVELYDLTTFTEKYCINPKQMIDVKALMGDKSDNIPGVAGIGEKTALKLICEYGSLQNLYDCIDKINSKAIKEKLITDKKAAFLSYELSAIDITTDHGFILDDAVIKDYNHEKLYELFQNLEFNSLSERLGLKKPVIEREESLDFKCPVSIAKDITQLDKFLEKAGELNIYAEYDQTEHPFIKFKFICLYAKKEALYINFNNIDYDEAVKKLHEIISGGITVNTYDLKQLFLALNGFDLNINKSFDLMIAAYILEPSSKDYSLENLVRKYLNSEINYDKCQTEDKTVQEAVNTAYKAEAVMVLKEKLLDGLQSNNQLVLYEEIEMPLIEVLAFMERTGFYVDKQALKTYSIELDKRIVNLINDIYNLAGHDFNINSPKQLGRVLFEELKLPPVKKTKTGYSTDVEVLEKLKNKHDIIVFILEYRQLVKLKSTYVDALYNLVNPVTQRIHSIFKQDVTVTGRISSIEPNLQNIPVRSEEGRKIRQVFTAGEGQVLIDADYSQIELRVLAHIANDGTMKDAFENNMDIHLLTAAKVFGVKPEEVTFEQRSGAKAVNFGIVYGIGEYSLSQDLNISIKEAKRYIDDYLEHYKGVAEYMKNVVKGAYDTGYVETIFKRRRYIDELKSSNKQIRSFGERVAMNAPIQGSAADIIKIAMISVYNKLKQNKSKAKLILQVHDELIIEAPANEADTVSKWLKECMEDAVRLSVKLTVDVNTGRSWFDTK